MPDQSINPGVAATTALFDLLADRETKQRQAMLDALKVQNDAQTRAVQQQQIAASQAAVTREQTEAAALNEQRAAAAAANNQKLTLGVLGTVAPGASLDAALAERLQANGLGHLIGPERQTKTAIGPADDPRSWMAPTYTGTPQQQQLQAMLDDPSTPATVRQFVRAQQAAGDTSLPYQLFQDPSSKTQALFRVSADRSTVERFDGATGAWVPHTGDIPKDAHWLTEPTLPAGGDVDIPAIAGAIMSGDQPPDLKGLYRYGAAVKSELAKNGYNLATAQTDWAATQRHFATLNGPQQTRLRQATDNAYHSLDVIEGLADQWKGGKFPALNRAQLNAAKAGTLGPQAQQIATNLEAMIADVTSELANVYMGGNSPTDHAMELAAKNLSADWSESQLRAAIAQGRRNLQIRQNSIANVGAITSSTPPAALTTPPSPKSGPATPSSDAPAPTVRKFDPLTGTLK